MVPTLITLAHHTHDGNPLSLVLLLLIAAGGWALSLLTWPWRSCPRCRGTGVKWGSTGRRLGRCKRCLGTRRTRRLGATTVHRIYWSARSDHHREHHRRRLDRTRGHTDYPEP